MFEQALAIIRNTFLESIRQPVLLILMIIAILALVASNALSGYTMEDDNRMMVDLGLSSVFLLGTLGAAFIATSVLTREIENKTALTVISKPVGRPLFVIGKFLGVGAALTIATLFMGFVFMLVNLHGVQQTVRIPYHQPVLTFGLSALALGLFVGVWSNYFYNKVFASTVLCVTTPLLAIAYGLSLMFDAGWGAQSPAVAFRGDLWLAILGLLTAILVLTAIAIAASTRLGQVMTLSVTVGVFLIGMLSDAMFGAPAHRIEQTWLDRAHETGKAHFVTIERVIHRTDGETATDEIETLVADEPIETFATGQERLARGCLRFAHAIVPNFQVHWLADTINQDHVIPRSYVVGSMSYGALNIGAILGIAVILFQRREVG